MNIKTSVSLPLVAAFPFTATAAAAVAVLNPRAAAHTLSADHINAKHEEKI